MYSAVETYLLVGTYNYDGVKVIVFMFFFPQTVEYSSSTGLRRHEDERRVLEVNRGEVKPGASASWGSAGVRLPPLPPSSFTQDSCKIISIQYRIDVTTPLMRLTFITDLNCKLIKKFFFLLL